MSTDQALQPGSPEGHDIPPRTGAASPVAPSTKPDDPRDWIYNLLWRLSATFGWIWLLGWFFPGLGLPDLLLRIRFWHAVGIVAAILFLYFLVKKDRGCGCAAIFLGYPIYFVFWPFTALILIFMPVGGAIDKVVKRSQQIRYALGTYALLAVAFVALQSPYAVQLVPAILFLLPLVALLILVSLGTWVFSPLAWIARPLMWAGRLHEEMMRKAAPPAPESYSTDPEGFKKALEKSVKAAISAATQLQKLPSIGPWFGDALVAGGFFRKLLISTLSLGLAFGLAHFAVQIEAAGTAYSGFLGTSLRDSWFDYWYFGTMTLLGRETGSAPSTQIARAIILGNALIGIGLFVFVVAVFTMLTREKASGLATEYRRKLQDAIKASEEAVYARVMLAYQARQLSPEILTEYRKMNDLQALPEAEQGALRGIVLHEQMIERLQEAGYDTDSLARALEFRGRLTPDQLARFHAEGDAKAGNLKDVVQVWRQIAGIDG